MPGRRSVDVCVPTLRRPAPLARLLRSLAAQELDGLRMRIVVADNDAEASARQVVEEFRRGAPCEVRYDVEPRRGYSFARNRALRHVRAPLMAWVDDDETVSARWLATLVQACDDFRADAVFGPVEPSFPPDVPAWARRHPVFRSERRPTGTRVTLGYAGNALVRSAALGRPRQQFALAYNGGCEDTELFHRLHLAGRRLVWCNEAVVEEAVPTTRTELAWVLRRSFRTGRCYARIHLAEWAPRARLAWGARKAAHLVGGVGLALAARPFSYPAFVELCSVASGAAGQLSACLGPTRIAEVDRADA